MCCLQLLLRQSLVVVAPINFLYVMKEAAAQKRMDVVRTMMGAVDQHLAQQVRGDADHQQCWHTTVVVVALMPMHASSVEYCMFMSCISIVYLCMNCVGKGTSNMQCHGIAALLHNYSCA